MRAYKLKSVVVCVVGFSFDFLPPQQANEAVQASWAFCENCLSVFCEFFHSMMPALSRWVSLCFLQGRSCSGGLFWVLFWAVAKVYLARGANTAMPNKNTTVNPKHQNTNTNPTKPTH